MDITPRKPTAKGPAAWFVGDTWIDPVVQGHPLPKLSVTAVHFAPGARTAWHSHEGGQTLYVTEGRGLVQCRGEQILEIGPGDVVCTHDGEEHWHGATPDHFMTHLAITQGSPYWGEHLSEDEYRAPRAHRDW